MLSGPPDGPRHAHPPVLCLCHTCCVPRAPVPIPGPVKLTFHSSNNINAERRPISRIRRSQTLTPRIMHTITKQHLASLRDFDKRGRSIHKLSCFALARSCSTLVRSIPNYLILSYLASPVEERLYSDPTAGGGDYCQPHTVAFYRNQ